MVARQNRTGKGFGVMQVSDRKASSALSISEVESGCWTVCHVVDKKYGTDPAKETLPLQTSLGLAGSDARACLGAAGPG